MNMQSGVVQNTGRTMQMNSFKAHSVLDQAWKQSHLSVMRLKCRCMDAQAGTCDKRRHWNIYLLSFLLLNSIFRKWEIKSSLSIIVLQQVKLFLFFAVAGIIVHIIVLIYILFYLFMFHSYIFSSEHVDLCRWWFFPYTSQLLLHEVIQRALSLFLNPLHCASLHAAKNTFPCKRVIWIGKDLSARERSAYCRRKLTLSIGSRVWPRSQEQLNLTLFRLDDGL